MLINYIDKIKTTCLYRVVQKIPSYFEALTFVVARVERK